MTFFVLIFAVGLFAFAILTPLPIATVFYRRRIKSSTPTLDISDLRHWFALAMAGACLTILFMFLVMVIDRTAAGVRWSRVSTIDIVLSRLEIAEGEKGEEWLNSGILATIEATNTNGADGPSREDDSRQELMRKRRESFVRAYARTWRSEYLSHDPLGLISIVAQEKQYSDAVCRSGAGALAHMIRRIVGNDAPETTDGSDETPNIDSCLDKLQAEAKIRHQIESLREGMLPSWWFDRGILGLTVDRPSPLFLWQNTVIDYSDLEVKIQAEPLAGELVLSQIALLSEAMNPFHRFRAIIVGPIQFIILNLFFSVSIVVREREMLLKHSDYYETIYTQRKTKNMKLTRQAFVEQLDASENAPIQYVIWGLPTIGFVGTVIGIGAALGDAAGVVYAQGVEQQGSAIELVTSQLSVAFDTTLMALVCSLPLAGVVARLRSRESKLFVGAAQYPKGA